MNVQFVKKTCALDPDKRLQDRVKQQRELHYTYRMIDRFFQQFNISAVVLEKRKPYFV